MSPLLAIEMVDYSSLLGRCAFVRRLECKNQRPRLQGFRESSHGRFTKENRKIVNKKQAINSSTYNVSVFLFEDRLNVGRIDSEYFILSLTHI